MRGAVRYEAAGNPKLGNSQDFLENLKDGFENFVADVIHEVKDVFD